MSQGVRGLCVVILLLVIAGSGTLCYGKRLETVTGVVVKVLDGDSFIMKRGKVAHEVRMWGIDCPEYTQPYSNHAKSLTKSMIEKKKVKVEMKYQDRYDREIGMVYLDGANINGELVRRGAAWVYHRYCDEPICEQWEKAETQAKEEKKGLWRRKNPLPPWQWRRKGEPSP